MYRLVHYLYKNSIFLLVPLALLTMQCSLDLNPCHDLKPTSAEFRVYQTLYYHENGQQRNAEIEEDTFMVNTYLTFEALDSNAKSYEWKIGDDSRIRTDRKFTRFSQRNSYRLMKH